MAKNSEGFPVRTIEVKTLYEDSPIIITRVEDLLYPSKNNIPNVLTKEQWDWLQLQAAKNLAEHPYPTSSTQNWRNLVYGILPVGWLVNS